jgi:flagellin-like hook-associated protein FlgL
MSTVTGAIQGPLGDIGKAGQAATRLGQQLITGRKINKAQDGPSTWLQAARSQSTAGLLDAIHTGLNELATSISAADTSMQAIGKLLSTMQGELEQAQKYQPGEPERRQLIVNANGIRQQIDDLVYTTSPAGARNLMSDPNRNAAAGSIQAVVGINGEAKVVHSQQVDVGKNGLNISLVPVNASDQQLQSALQNLDTAQTTLDARRNGLATDASDITRYTAQSSSVSAFYQGEAESLTGVDETEAALELQSVNVRQSLAVESLMSITTSRNDILQLLH